MSVAVKERPAQKGTASKRLLVKDRRGQFSRAQEIDRMVQPVKGKAGEAAALAKLRAALGWSRNFLARVINASERAIVNWEAGDPMSPVYAAKLRELQSICEELAKLMKPEEMGTWLRTEMEEFEGRSPADLIERGETGRLWASLFYLRTGMPE